MYCLLFNLVVQRLMPVTEWILHIFDVIGLTSCEKSRDEIGSKNKTLVSLVFIDLSH